MIGFSPIELGVLSLFFGAALWTCRGYITVRGMLHCAAVLLLLAAMAIAALGTIFSLGSDHDIARSIAKNRSIEASFHDAADFVERFRQERSRLPSQAEFGEWCSKRERHGLWIEAPPRSLEAMGKLGQPSADGYLLVYWRGEWHEYFASWSKASTLVFDPSRYYHFGGPLQDAAAWMGSAAALFVAGILLWR